MTDTRSEAFLRMVCFCLFLPFVGKGAKNTKGQMLQQVNHYGYWRYLCFIYLGRTAQTPQRSFSKVGGFKRKVCSVTTRREVIFDRQIFVTILLDQHLALGKTELRKQGCRHLCDYLWIKLILHYKCLFAAQKKLSLWIASSGYIFFFSC